jgi:hypothetical protein
LEEKSIEKDLDRNDMGNQIEDRKGIIGYEYVFCILEVINVYDRSPYVLCIL